MLKLCTSLIVFSSIFFLTACEDEQPAAYASVTLDRIKRSGVMNLGHRDSAIPFSYMAEDADQPIGYAHDLQLHIIEAVKQELNLPDLKLNYHHVNGQDRIEMIQQGIIDLECGATTNNKERQQQVDFSVGYFQARVRLLVHHSSGIKDYADLRDKVIVTTASTTSARYLQQHQARLGFKEIILAKDHIEAFDVLQQGMADAFMMDDILLAGERSKAQHPEEWIIVGTAPMYEIYACMMTKGDVQFKNLVNSTIKKIYQSGEINDIYKKWFLSPIPPKQANLHLAMPPVLKSLIQAPHDRDQ